MYKEINLLELENLDYNPVLRTLIINYMMQMYECSTKITEDEILQELRYLVTNDRLQEIFITEFQSQQARSCFQ